MSPDRRLLSGWGRTAPTAADVVRPADSASVVETMSTRPPRGVIARGLGRAYGDAAQNAGGVVIDCTDLAVIHAFDESSGLITVDAGLSVGALLEAIVARGWFVPVTPGTKHVTIGGAIAADVHGKNHHRDGSIGNALVSIDVVTPGGTTCRLDPSSTPRPFWATVGGLGLTGVITSATLRLVPIETSLLRVDTSRIGHLDELMSEMEHNDDRYRYSVAWIDLAASGRSLGRSVLTRGDHARLDELSPRGRTRPLQMQVDRSIPAPPWAPSGLLNPLSVRAFNELWFRHAPRERLGELQTIRTFFHPLDLVSGWNRLYGRHGFVQYQCVLPFGQEGALVALIDRLGHSGQASFLAVLKRFGAANEGPLSFPLPGWTLALDVPARGHELAHLLDELDRLVVDAGGRVYLAKDSRLDPALLAPMYPRLAEWEAARFELDPCCVLQSDLARRLGIGGRRA